jgi:hypothetical protein
MLDSPIRADSSFGESFRRAECRVDLADMVGGQVMRERRFGGSSDGAAVRTGMHQASALLPPKWRRLSRMRAYAEAYRIVKGSEFPTRLRLPKGPPLFGGLDLTGRKD